MIMLSCADAHPQTYRCVQHNAASAGQVEHDKAAEECIRALQLLAKRYIQNLPFWLEEFPTSFMGRYQFLEPFRRNGTLDRSAQSAVMLSRELHKSLTFAQSSVYTAGGKVYSSRSARNSPLESLHELTRSLAAGTHLLLC